MILVDMKILVVVGKMVMVINIQKYVRTQSAKSIKNI